MMSMTAFEQHVSQYIAQHHLLTPSDKYLIALSGGADSVSLLLVLQHLGYHIEACHCNFHLRGKESDRDEQFCMELCQKLHIPLHRIHFDTKEYASLHKVSIEMAARDLRYRYFEQLLGDLDAKAICVAHHKDDSVETMLINLIRGTGINGLTGISPQNGHVIRPLLDIGRTDILQYLEQQQQTYVTDSTNLIDDVVRNKIRLHIIPMLKEINPAVVDNINTTARYLSEANKMLRHMIDNTNIVSALNKQTLSIDKQLLVEQASPEYVLHAILAKYHFSGPIIRDILSSINAVGKRWQSSTHQLVIDRKCLLLKAIATVQTRNIKIPETGNYMVPDLGKLKVKIYDKDEDFKPSKESLRITIDACKVKFPLLLRQAQKGDRFQPFGMKGSKLISDYLTDIKCNVFEKESQMVIADAQGSILWLVGWRTSERCKISHETTSILQLELIPQDEQPE